MNVRLTITQVAKKVGVTARTIKRWEDTGKIRKAKRDWRGWRVFENGDVEEIKNFHENLVICE